MPRSTRATAAARWSIGMACSSASSPPSSTRMTTCSSGSAWPSPSMSPAVPPACCRTRPTNGRASVDQHDGQDRSAPMERLLYEVKKVIVGQDHLLERLVIALLCRGHILVEGVPGLAKTMAIKTLADTIGGEFKRIQFTPDLVPADLVGTRIYNQKTGEFGTSLGPVFTNLLLADEINRAPAKVQSALLAVMQERQGTIGPATYKVPNPFLLLRPRSPLPSRRTHPA